MAGTPDASTEAQHYVDFDEYVDFHLARTRANIKYTEVFTALVSVGTLFLVYLLGFAIFDQWVIAGGFGYGPRVVMLSVLLLITAALLVRSVAVPLIRKVNALYAARVIESADPALKSSLLNIVDLRNSGAPITRNMLQAMEKRAAIGLSHVDVEHAVDRRPLLRISCVLLAVVVAACLYTVLSPKDVFSSVKRALLPAAPIAVATQTTISEVTPGDDRLPARSFLAVEADIRGKQPERVNLLYTTSDRKFVDQAVEMRRLEENQPRFRGVINGENGRGLMQSLKYQIVAGDARTREFTVDVIQPPSAKVEGIQYTFPSYMHLPEKSQTGADIDGWEGAEVTLNATANMPLKSAQLVFTDVDDPKLKGEELSMTVSGGTKLTARWKLAFRSDGTAARFYRVHCVTAKGETDPNPALHSIRIRPDQAPEIALLAPTGDLQMPANGIVPLIVQASDPDFKLRFVTLRAEHEGETLVEQPLFEAQLEGEASQSVRGGYDFELAPLHLKPGQTFQFWIEARDNKREIANRKNTPRLNISIIDPVTPQEAEQQLADDKRKQTEDQLARADDAFNPSEAGESQSTDDDGSTPEDTPDGRERQPQQDDREPPGDQKRQDGDDQPPEGEQKQGEGAEQKPDDAQRDADALEKLIQRHLQRQQEQQPKEGQAGESAPKDGATKPDPGQQKSGGNSKSDKQQTASDRSSKSGDKSSKPADNRGKTTSGKPGDSGQAPAQKPETTGQKDPTGQSGQRASEKNDEQKPKADAKSPPGKDSGTPPSPDAVGDKNKPTARPGESSRDPDEQPNPSAGEKNKDGAPPAGDKQKPMPTDKPGPQSSGEKDPQKPKSDTGDSGMPPEKSDGSEKGDPGTTKPPKNDAPMDKGAGDKGAGDKGAGDKGSPEKDAPEKSDSKGKDGTGDKSKPDGAQPDGQQGGGGEKGKPAAADTPDAEPMPGAGNEPGRKQPGPAREGADKRPSDGDDPGTGNERPADDAPDAVKKQATGNERGPAEGNPERDPDAVKAKQDLNRKPGSKPGAKKPADQRPTGQPPAGDDARQDSGTDPAEAKPAPSRKSDEPQERNPADHPEGNPDQKPDQPAARTGEQPDGANEKVKGQGRKPGQKSEQPEGGEEGSSKSDSQGQPGGNKPGAGDTAQKPGAGEKSDRPTGGESSKDEGAGAKSRPAPDGREPKAGSGEPGESESKQGTAKPGDGSSKSASDKPGKGDQEQGGTPASGKSDGQPSGKGASEPGAAGKPGGEAGSSNSGSSPEGAGTTAPGGNQSAEGNQGTPESSTSDADEVEKANLEYARKATNLVLKRLKEQIDRGEVDQELLDELGWTEKEMEQFARRLEAQLNQSESSDDSPEAHARRLEFEETLKGLQLGSETAQRNSNAARIRRTRQIDARRLPVPAEYREQYEAYTKSLSKQQPPPKKP